MPVMSYAERILAERYLKRKKCILATLITLYALAAIFLMTIFLIGLNHFMKQQYPTLESGPWDDFKLPASYDAKSYDLYMYPDFYDEEGLHGFEGNLTISLQIHKPTRYLLLHKMNLTIEQYSFLKDTTDLSSNIYSTFAKNDYWIIKSKSEFAAGEDYKLRMMFSGRWRTKSYSFGFYKSHFFDQNDKKRFLVSTKFEPNGARLAFPCLDEPQRKSYYTIHLVHKTNCIALSNMPQKGSDYYHKRHRDGDLLVVTHFHPNPIPMSTYLVAFVVAESFGHSLHTMNSRRSIRIYGPAHRVNETEFAGQFTVRMQNYLENLYGIKDPMPKLDQIYIPQFARGAMENWGLVTYRESRLMLSMGDLQKYSIIKTVTHELCHTWFGNIVTMRWWNDIWLNEGLATYCQIQALNATNPEYSPYDRHFSMYFLGSKSFLQRDKLNGKENLVRRRVSNADIFFNSYIYKKGASILIWLETLVGQKFVLKSLKSYLHKYQFKTATTENFWEVFQKNSTFVNYSDFTVWLERGGYPLVSVDYNPEINKFIIKQRPCCNQQASLNAVKIWPIYLQYRTSKSNQSQTIKLKTVEGEFSIEEFDNDNAEDWIVFNSESVGLYRVEYDSNLWDRICRALKSDHHQFNPFQRARLVDDAVRLTDHREKPFNYTMNIVSYMVNENHYLPWKGISRFCVFMSNLPSGLAYLKRFELPLSRIVASVNEENSLRTKYNYVQISCALNHSTCFDRVDQYSQMLGAYEHEVARGLTFQLYYYSIMKNNTQQNFDAILSKTNNTNYQIYMTALLMTHSRENFVNILHRLLLNNKYLCPLSLGCPLNLFRKVWRWVKSTCVSPKQPIESQICRKIMKKTAYLYRLVKYLTEQEDIEEFRSFSRRMVLDKKFELKVIKLIGRNIKFKRYWTNEFATWLDNNSD